MLGGQWLVLRCGVGGDMRWAVVFRQVIGGGM